jgi:hypothetical protein
MKFDLAAMQKVRAQTTCTIEQSHIVRFCDALGITDPVHLDEKTAKSNGYRNVVAPPTFLVTLEPTDEIGKRLNIDPNRLMLVEQKWEYHQPLCAGDEVMVTARIAHAHEKIVNANTRVAFLVIETIGRTKKNQPLFKGLRTFLYTRSKNQTEG